MTHRGVLAEFNVDRDEKVVNTISSESSASLLAAEASANNVDSVRPQRTPPTVRLEALRTPPSGIGTSQSQSRAVTPLNLPTLVPTGDLQFQLALVGSRGRVRLEGAAELFGWGKGTTLEVAAAIGRVELREATTASPTLSITGDLRVSLGRGSL